VAEVVLFHHAQGLTDGVRGFAATLEGAGHTVHLPDLFEGKVFGTLDEGVAHVDAVGMEELVGRGIADAHTWPAEVVYAGFSLGVVVAQRLTQTRAGAKGAVLCYSFVPPHFFGDWPAGVPVQIHGMDGDPFFAGEGDLEAARGFVAEHPEGELFVYPGEAHLFADSSLDSYDEAAAALLTERVLAFLSGVS
jgi:dienelactone hydrolase